MTFGMRCVARLRCCSKADGADLGWCPRQAGQHGCGSAGGQPFGKAAAVAPCGVARLGQAASLSGGMRLAWHHGSGLRTHPKGHNTLQDLAP